MKFIVSNIVDVSMNKMALWISVGVDDWTAKLAIIASNKYIWNVTFKRERESI